MPLSSLYEAFNAPAPRAACVPNSHGAIQSVESDQEDEVGVFQNRLSQGDTQCFDNQN